MAFSISLEEIGFLNHMEFIAPVSDFFPMINEFIKGMKSWLYYFYRSTDSNSKKTE